MRISENTLVEVIQTSMHTFDEATSVFTPLGIPGLRGKIGPTFEPIINLVGMARLDESTADGVIRQVIDRFSSENKGFGWVVGPSSTPADLGTRLEAAGLKMAEEAAGMALTDLHQPISGNPAIRIEEVEWGELRKEADLFATAMGFGTTRDGIIAEFDALEALQDRYPGRAYLAFSDDSEAPVGFSTMMHTTVPGVVCLFGSATVEVYRRRGIYRSFVARRVADARTKGAQAAVVQAARRTSAPILQRLGFRDLCSLYLYAWTPSGS
jgi:hypothetical protein